MNARRYLTIIQDRRGYPPPKAPLEPVLPEGPAQPVVHSVVLADDYDRLHDLAERAVEALRYEANPICDEWDAAEPPLTE